MENNSSADAAEFQEIFFCETFDKSKVQFECWQHQLESAFAKFNVKTPALKTNYLLRYIGAESYGMLCDKLAPEIPACKSYEFLVKMLAEHFDSARGATEIADHYRFHRRRQHESESLEHFLLVLRRLSLHCNFGGYLDTALRNQFVFGMLSQQIRNRLLKEKRLTLEKAVEMANSMQMEGNVQSNEDADSPVEAGDYGREEDGELELVMSLSVNSKEMPTSSSRRAGFDNVAEFANMDKDHPTSSELSDKPTVSENKLTYKQTYSSAHDGGLASYTNESHLEENQQNSSDLKNSRELRITRHFLTDTTGKPFRCEFCDYNCNKSSDMKKHVRTHTGEKPFRCEFCDYRTTQSGHLKNHVASHTGDKPFSCNFCDYRTTQSSHLRYHIRIHTGEKPYSCQFCDYRTTHSSVLKTHLRIHSGEKHISCEFCDYKTTQSSSLKTHKKTHSGDKPFSCELCDFKTAYQNSLKTHKKSHSADKPFSCEFCDYKTAHSSYLKSHKRTHTDDEPFSCKFCDYKTTQPRQLKSHLKIHSGEKPFSCKFCDYRASRLSDLNRHLLVHASEKPFCCEFCDYKCSRLGSLKVHLRVHKPGKSPS